MTSPNIEAVAQALLSARRAQLACDATPLAASLVTPEDAYGVQERVAQAMAWYGDAPPACWKSGGPSRDAVLTHAGLPPQGVWSSPAMAGDWPFHIRLIEAEVALRLGQAVSADRAAGLDLQSATSLVDAMTVSIEIVDSRWRQGVDAPALLKLADLQSHGALVLGDWVPFSARNWAQQTCHVQIGAQSTERRGTHSCGDPAWVLAAWLRHATRHGQSVPAGTIVTTGTWVGMLPASAGDLVTARFEGIGQASVQL